MRAEPTQGDLDARYGLDWEIRDWYGHWVAIRRNPVSRIAAEMGVEAVVAGEKLGDLARKLAAQAEVEIRLTAALSRPRPRTPATDPA